MILNKKRSKNATMKKSEINEVIGDVGRGEIRK